MDRPLNGRDAVARMGALWRAGRVVFTLHAAERMLARGILAVDLERVRVRTGRVAEVTRPGLQWRYCVEGATIDGRRIRCITEMDEGLLIITVIDLSR